MKALLAFTASVCALSGAAHAENPRINFDARIAVDAGFVSNGDNTANEFETRFIWLGAKGEIAKDWSYRMLIAFDGDEIGPAVADPAAGRANRGRCAHRLGRRWATPPRWAERSARRLTD